MLLEAGLNFLAIVSIGARGIVQAVVGVSSVFFSAWYLGRLFGLDKKLRAVMSTSVSICGVSAAIAAVGEGHRVIRVAPQDSFFRVLIKRGGES